MTVCVQQDKLVKNPMVSVFCNAYNQGDYIKRCLDSLVSQRTTFEFEILVTDDASTDQTAEIIALYAQQYPHLFTAVLNEENQYSQGVNHNVDVLFPKARGRYIAFCEGDDYWIDSNKLQKQFEAMERHKTASWCVHSSIYVDADSEKEIAKLCRYEQDTIICFPETDKHIQLAATASFFIRYDVYADYANSILSKGPGHGDFRMSRFFSLKGDTIYLADSMSAYRVLAKGSINAAIAKSSDWRRHIQQNTKDRVDYLKILNGVTKDAYAKEFALEIDDMEYYGAMELKDWHALVSKWPSRFSLEPLRTRIKVLILGKFPNTHDLLRRIKSRLYPRSGLKV